MVDGGPCRRASLEHRHRRAGPRGPRRGARGQHRHRGRAGRSAPTAVHLHQRGRGGHRRLAGRRAARWRPARARGARGHGPRPGALREAIERREGRADLRADAAPTGRPARHRRGHDERGDGRRARGGVRFRGRRDRPQGGRAGPAPVRGALPLPDGDRPRPVRDHLRQPLRVREPRLRQGGGLRDGGGALRRARDRPRGPRRGGGDAGPREVHGRGRPPAADHVSRAAPRRGGHAARSEQRALRVRGQARGPDDRARRERAQGARGAARSRPIGSPPSERWPRASPTRSTTPSPT